MSITNKRFFSGIQPTGALHIGNYLGAILNWSKLVNDPVNKSAEFIFCIVDLHAITVEKNRTLHDNIRKTFAMYFACGVDPSLENVSVFQQSKISAHTELAWILNCYTPIGWLNRMTQFKEKSNNQENASAGLYTYPVLMAADVLLYDAGFVPVGEDQLQHVELMRDIAARFNSIYEEQIFTVPEPIINKSTKRIMSLRDGLKKMSKSEESDASRINLSDDDDVIIQKIKKAKTDSLSGINFDLKARPEIANLLSIAAGFLDKNAEDVAAQCQNMQTGQFKQFVADVVISKLSPIRKKYEEILQNQDYLNRMIDFKLEKITSLASKKVDLVKRKVGFIK